MKTSARVLGLGRCTIAHRQWPKVWVQGYDYLDSKKSDSTVTMAANEFWLEPNRKSMAKN